jgi:outer membrane receptor for ferrienterochelin and colicins
VYVNDYAGTGTPPFTLNQDLSVGDRVTLAFDASRIFFEKHRVTVGAETQFNLKQDQSNDDLAPYSLYLDDHRSSTVPAIYLQDEFSVRKDLIASAGVRWDHYGTFGSTVNPRLGLIYSPGKRTTLKVLYGSAFRAPNAYELYYAAPPDQAASLLLQPETIRTTEIVFGQRLTKHVQLVISGFYNDLRGLISQQADPATGLISYANLENVHGKGVDFELAGKWRNGVEGRVSYTLQQSRDERSGTMLTDSPKNLAKVNATVPIASKRLFASMEGQFRGQVGTLAGQQIGGFVIANATLSSPEIRGFIISGGAYNIFSKRYADPGGVELMEDSIVQNGRTFRAKVTYRFGKR